MSQQTVLPQTVPMDSHGPAAIRLSPGAPNVDEVTPGPYGARNGGSDLELRVMNLTSDDVEAGGTARTLAFPNERSTVENAPQDPSGQPPPAEIQGLTILLLSNIATIPFTSVFAFVDLAFGNLVLLDVPPFDSVGIWTELEACAVGVAVVGPAAAVAATAAILVLRRPRRPFGSGSRSEPDFNVGLVFVAICTPVSVLVMPLGFTMLPYLATEAFGAPHALVVSTAGLGAFSVVALCLLGPAAMIRWCCMVRL